MDNKQLIEKFINGDLSDEQFESERAKMTPEDQKTFDKEAEASLPSAVERLKNVRRGIDKISQKKGESSEDAMSSRMREENLTEAKNTFFLEMGIEKDEDKTAFDLRFKKHDSGAINVKNIISDMQETYAALNKDEFLSLKKEKMQRQQEAEDVIAEQAGGGNGSGGAGGKIKISKEVENFIKESAKIGRNITPEQAQKAIDIARNRGRIV